VWDRHFTIKLSNFVATLYHSSMKSTKERLSSLALEEIFGRENMDTLFEENDSNDGDERDMEATDSGSFSEKVRCEHF
jgi:hypothetical protein